jgi:hypothetical protein
VNKEDILLNIRRQVWDFVDNSIYQWRQHISHHTQRLDIWESIGTPIVRAIVITVDIRQQVEGDV